MSDKISGFFVTLDDDHSEEGAETVRQAIMALKHVIAVTANVSHFSEHIGQERAKWEIYKKIVELVR